MKMKKDSYYVMSGTRISDGPFDKEEAVEFLKQLATPYASPEHMQLFLAYFDGNKLDLAKTEDGAVITLASIG